MGLKDSMDARKVQVEGSYQFQLFIQAICMASVKVTLCNGEELYIKETNHEANHAEYIGTDTL